MVSLAAEEHRLVVGYLTAKGGLAGWSAGRLRHDHGVRSPENSGFGMSWQEVRLRPFSKRPSLSGGNRMALLVDPPQRDNADERPSAEVPADAPGEAATASATQVVTEPEPIEPAPSETVPAPSETAPAPGETAENSQPRLAEPPLTGGRVEARMGRLIRVLSHSRLARPLPAVLLSAFGL